MLLKNLLLFPIPFTIIFDCIHTNTLQMRRFLVVKEILVAYAPLRAFISPSFVKNVEVNKFAFRIELNPPV